MRIMVSALGVGLWVAGSVAAQAPDKVSGELIGCLAQIEDAKRLACYDSTVKSLSAEARRVSESREAAAIGAKQKREAEAMAEAAKKSESEFGKRATSDAAVEEIHAQIKSTHLDHEKRLVVSLDNGQTWRQAESRMLPPIKSGMDVTVERGSFGSYRMLIPSAKRTIPVTRIR